MSNAQVPDRIVTERSVGVYLELIRRCLGNETIRSKVHPHQPPGTYQWAVCGAALLWLWNGNEDYNTSAMAMSEMPSGETKSQPYSRHAMPNGAGNSNRRPLLLTLLHTTGWLFPACLYFRTKSPEQPKLTGTK